MKKSPQEIKALGWEPCAGPHITLRFYSPWRDSRAECQKCNDKGYAYTWGDGYGKGLGQCYRRKCTCRGGRQVQHHVDREFQTALDWFKQSEPPTEGFQLHPWLFVKNPEEFWGKIWAELETNSVYGMERVRDDVVTLYQLLSME